MKKQILRLVGTGLLSIGLAAAPLAGIASAQVEEAPGGAAQSAQRADDGFDWGWLGLLGLAGLLGLMRRDRHDRVHHTSGTTTAGNTSRV